MCCFTGTVQTVSATHIFARPFPAGTQLLAYGMSVALDDALAMVLPIPTPPRSPDDAVQFIDMSSCPDFFDHLAALFPAPLPAGFGAPQARDAERSARLVVHSVGDFEASFVPTLADFSRLDPRFRFADDVWRSLPEYADWGFTVFKLKPRDGVQKLHPMAFVFPRRDPDAVFFPTVHVHDGVVHDFAAFDHTLYVQPDATWDPLVTWTRAAFPASSIAEPARAFVHPTDPIFKESYQTSLPNQDVWLRGEVLRGRCAVAPHFAVRINSAWGFFTSTGRGVTHNPFEQVLPEVARELSILEPERIRARDITADVFTRGLAARGAAWGVLPLRFDLPPMGGGFFPGGVGAPGAPQPCLVTLFEYARRVRGINVFLSFPSQPSQEVLGELRALLQEAVHRIDT